MVPKEIVWITRLLWICVVARLFFILTVSSTFGLAGLVYAIQNFPEIWFLPLSIFALNYYLLKGNIWSMGIIFMSEMRIIIMSIFSIPQGGVLFKNGLLKFEYFFVNILYVMVAIVVIYLLIQRREFFNKSLR